jgi:hypothetical protein
MIQEKSVQTENLTQTNFSFKTETFSAETFGAASGNNQKIMYLGKIFCFL